MLFDCVCLTLFSVYFVMQFALSLLVIHPWGFVIHTSVIALTVEKNNFAVAIQSVHSMETAVSNTPLGSVLRRRHLATILGDPL